MTGYSSSEKAAEDAAALQTYDLERDIPAAGFCSGSGMETVQVLGQEWVRPVNAWSSSVGTVQCPFSGVVAVHSNCGWLLLARVEKVCEGPDTGKIRRVLVRPDELNSI